MILSLLINSKNIKKLEKVFDSYEKNAFDPSTFEIIVNINNDHLEMKKFLDSQIIIRKFSLKYIAEYEGDYFSGHINNSKLLKEADKSSYFILAPSDRVLMHTKNWDNELRKYVKLFDDDIFRIRCHIFKNRKYFDFWECCFAPAPITFATKKSLEINNNNFSPCFSDDAFQQCIYYYLENHDNFNAKQINRDIVDNNLKFIGGEAPEEKTYEENYIRIHGQLKCWKIITSARVQKEAYRRAIILKCNIKFNNIINDVIIYESGNYICVKNKLSGVIIKYKFTVNNVNIFLKNFFRKFSYLNYAGSGFKDSPYTLFFSIIWYLTYRYIFFKPVKNFFNRYFFNPRNFKK